MARLYRKTLVHFVKNWKIGPVLKLDQCEKFDQQWKFSFINYMYNSASVFLLLYSAKLWCCQTLANLAICLSIAKFNPPKFSKLCTMIHLVFISPKFSTSKFLMRPIRQSLAPPKFSTIRYYVHDLPTQ